MGNPLNTCSCSICVMRRARNAELAGTEISDADRAAFRHTVEADACQLPPMFARAYLMQALKAAWAKCDELRKLAKREARVDTKKAFDAGMRKGFENGRRTGQMDGSARVIKELQEQVDGYKATNSRAAEILGMFVQPINEVKELVKSIELRWPNPAGGTLTERLNRIVGEAFNSGYSKRLSEMKDLQAGYDKLNEKVSELIVERDAETRLADLYRGKAAEYKEKTASAEKTRGEAEQTARHWESRFFQSDKCLSDACKQHHEEIELLNKRNLESLAQIGAMTKQHQKDQEKAFHEGVFRGREIQAAGGPGFISNILDNMPHRLILHSADGGQQSVVVPYRAPRVWQIPTKLDGPLGFTDPALGYPNRELRVTTRTYRIDCRGDLPNEWHYVESL